VFYTVTTERIPVDGGDNDARGFQSEYGYVFYKVPYCPTFYWVQILLTHMCYQKMR
jgi:hypothetical protein